MNRLIYMLFLSTQVMAAGGEGHGSPSDLIAPAVNVILLVSFLVWKLRGPINAFFQSKAEEVKTSLEKAEKRAAEVEKLYREQKEKMDNLEQTISEAKSEGQTEVTNFKGEMAKTLKERIEDLEDEAKAKINAHKSEALSELEEELLNKVISQTKNKISTDQNVAENVKNSLLGRM